MKLFHMQTIWFASGALVPLAEGSVQFKWLIYFDMGPMSDIWSLFDCFSSIIDLKVGRRLLKNPFLHISFKYTKKQVRLGLLPWCTHMRESLRSSRALLKDKEKPWLKQLINWFYGLRDLLSSFLAPSLEFGVEVLNLKGNMLKIFRKYLFKIF